MSAGAQTLAGPFKGLAPFQDTELDALLFFGREREREIVLANLMASRLTVLYGASGVGKTSLLRAAVAHSLRDVPDSAVVVFSSWAGDPGRGLREGIEDAVGFEGGGTLVEILQAASEAVGGDVYVILDQFEEYFLYERNGAGPGFAGELAAAIREPGLRANFLLGLREDALAKLDAFKTRIPNLFGNYLRLDHLDRSGGREAIVRPLERYGELGGEAVSVEPALVEAVLDQVQSGRVDHGVHGRGAVAGTGDAGRIETPYLQLVMQRLWEEERAAGSTTLRLATLTRLGGAERIVAEHLERAMATLAPSERDEASRVFNHLVTPSGMKIAHGLGDLAKYAGAPPREVEEVVERLAQARVLRPVAAPDEPDAVRYEIFHDVLADAVLGWRVRHESQRELERERAAAQRRHRRLLRVIAVAFVALAAMTAVAVYALTQRSEARKQASHAQVERRVAEQQAALARSQSALAKRQRASAQAAARAAKTARREAVRQASLAKAHQRDAVRQAQVAQEQRRIASDEAAKEAAATQSARQSAAVARASRAQALTQRSQALAAAAQARRARAAALASATLAQKRGRYARAQRARALAQARRARARAFAEEARSLLLVQPERSVLLARKAAKLERTALVEDVLRSSLAAMRVRKILPGGGGGVQSASFSRDGRLVLITSARGGARVFRAGTGKLVRTQDGSATAAAFDQDGSVLATGDRDGRVRLWRSGDDGHGGPHFACYHTPVKLPRRGRLAYLSRP